MNKHIKFTNKENHNPNKHRKKMANLIALNQKKKWNGKMNEYSTKHFY